MVQLLSRFQHRQARQWPSYKQIQLSRLAMVGLWVCVVLGAAGGVATLIRSSSPAARPPAPAPTADSANAQSFAEAFVVTWLSAGKDQEALLLPFYPNPVRLERNPGDFKVNWAGSSARRIEPGYWSVIVATLVDQATPSGFQSLGTRHYQVGVLEKEGRLQAILLPSIVPSPEPGLPVEPVLRHDGNLPETATKEALHRFFLAYLAGQGELSRYTPPNSPLRAVIPAPFLSIKLVSGTIEESGESADVMVEVDGTDQFSRITRTAYELRMVRREGQWEVVELIPPRLAQPTNNGDPND